MVKDQTAFGAKGLDKFSQSLDWLLRRVQFVSSVRPFDDIADRLRHTPGISFGEQMGALVLVFHITG